MGTEIRRIELTNFQSHSHTEIIPAPPGGLTVIVGPSGHGKTAVLRALRWLLYNQPQGAKFMRIGAQMMEATAELSDGTVSRRRTAATNQYIAVTEAAGRQVFEGFGTDVPLEVQQLTGVRPIRIADLTLQPNLARQLDGPFLGEEAVSAGVRAKVLGKIAGLDEVDLAAKSLATDQYRRGQEERRLEREVADLAAREATYAHLPEQRRRIEALDALVAELTRAEERRVTVTRAAERLRQISTARQQAQAAVERWAGVLPMSEASIARAEAAVARQAHVATLAARIRTVQMGLQAARATLTRWAGADEALETMIDCIFWVERTRRMASLAASLQQVRDGIAAARTTLAGTAGADQALEILASAVGTLERRTRLTALATSLRQTRADAAVTQTTLTRAADAAQAAEPLTHVAGALERQTRLLRLQATRQGLAHARSAAETALARYGQAEQVAIVATAAGDSLARVARLAKLQKDLGFTRILIGGARTVIQEEATKAERAQEEYIETLTAAGRCPVCGGEIDPEHLKEAV